MRPFRNVWVELRIILKSALKIYSVKTWGGFIWLMLEISSDILLEEKQKFRFREICRIS